eukprot:gnl/TRDRNA2_/TRDRNA2_165276_c3_seq1.p1 gnl/TRDRNA2_/TRDRNA2_165276_c3~~gnl/TRDRNA2_/TRDRNA2_165276_c3_seq1.p1  ORF type:complete len:418 (-),score=94.70 gnl/TRDRNA2_/TRDRNA2_165276_c3_seq1:12-1265(-)
MPCTYVRELLGALGLQESYVTKLQMGGPNSDVGSNEILQSKDQTVALLDASGVAYDPAGLQRQELERLARLREPIANFDRQRIGPGGFLVLVGESSIVLPDGSRWRTGRELLNGFLFTPYARADLFVPCAGRPAMVNAQNVKELLQGGTTHWKMVVEGADLVLTEEACRCLEEAGVHIFRGSTANKGGVTLSSLEALASLVMKPEDHELLLTPDFYSKYIPEIIQRIEENCRDEFRVIWQAAADTTESQQRPQSRGGPGAMRHLRQRIGVNSLGQKLSDARAGVLGAAPPILKIDASKHISQEINELQDSIAASELDNELVSSILQQALPRLLLEKCGLEALKERMPESYVKAMVANWLAAKFVYEHGIESKQSSYAFCRFMSRFSAALDIVGRSRANSREKEQQQKAQQAASQHPR